MTFADLKLLNKIKPQNLFCDHKSLEQVTGVVKKKYKLAGHALAPLKVYAFFITTTNLASCQSKFTVTIKRAEWNGIRLGHLPKTVGYIDVCNAEVLDSTELLKKMKDKTNGFPFVARLSNKKFLEIRNKSINIHQSKSSKFDDGVMVKLATKILDTSQVSDDVLKKLGLA